MSNKVGDEASSSGNCKVGESVFKHQPSRPNISIIETEILDFWKKNNVFENSVISIPNQKVIKGDGDKKFSRNETPGGTTRRSMSKSVLCDSSIQDGYNSDLHSSNGDDSRPEYVFYDGPPFANGLPHYGHLLTGYVKDIVPRFQTMKGNKVERRFGWDCHGLPAEMEAEKELKVSGRYEIEEFGVDNFNKHCRESVLKYTKEWQSFVTRMGRWVDFDNDYKTLDLTYMESVIWAFKQLWDKGLVYEGSRVVPYSWACETVLSNFETKQDDSYRSKQDPALTVKLPLKSSKSKQINAIIEQDADVSLLIWTTTPWTLPSNLAVAVASDLEYVVLKLNDEYLVMAASAVTSYSKELKEAEEVARVKGQDLVGSTYEPPFNYAKQAKSLDGNLDACFKVLEGDFVTADDGTGLVHCAPGFGEEDQKVCKANGIPTFCPVDVKGRFTSEVKDYENIQVFETNKPIIKVLKSAGKVLRHETIDHNYPHCWRTDTPLIYKAVSSWYIKVTDIKDRMVELNQQINWIPNHIKDGQFGKWLENARDWSVSRTRFWGTPIPVWSSDDPSYPRVDVYGSLEELEKDFGVEVKDLHRPFIDDLVRPNPDDPTGKSMMRRVPEVFDCWFESGSMPYAQVHYPFENEKWFEQNFPADFIVEYVSQTRGWFYTLMVLSTALFDKPPFLNCMCHGVVLDENGKKLSKRLRNYPDPHEVFDNQGSDALRWFLVSSSVLRGGDILIDKNGKGISETVKNVINPIWNSFYFLTLYSNADNIVPEFDLTSKHSIDRFILSKTSELITKVDSNLSSYDISGACNSIINFVGALNNWYIRRSRERFWRPADKNSNSKDLDKVAAYNTLYSVLLTLCKVSAPLLPHLSEYIYKVLCSKVGQEFSDENSSIHLTSWPDATEFPNDTELAEVMDEIREVCSIGLALRESNSLRTRLPLQSVTIVNSDEKVLSTLKTEEFIELVKDELNVKDVLFSDSVEEFATKELSVNSRVLGPRLGKEMKKVIIASKSGDWQYNDSGSPVVAGVELQQAEYEIKVKPKDGFAADVLSHGKTLVVLNIKLNQKLESEGVARDLVRAVQQARKEADLHVSDKIDLKVVGSEALKTTISEFKNYISQQTLSEQISILSSQSDETKGYHFAQTSIMNEEVSLLFYPI